jgi:molecular chaperone GrpE (heat shock protein)
MKSEKTEPGKGGNPQTEVIAEMMLAKTVLEEKNELLARQERAIRELKETALRLEDDLKELRAERDRWRETGRQEGALQVVAEAARMAVEYLAKEQDRWGLAPRLIRHFAERYGLELVDEAAEEVDPELHQVLEVVETPEQVPSVQILTPGFRLAGSTVQPALVRVIRGKDADHPPAEAPASESR